MVYICQLNIYIMLIAKMYMRNRIKENNTNVNSKFVRIYQKYVF